MNTDDLSLNAYCAILIEAYDFHEDLELHFDYLAEYCIDEEEYLHACEKLIEYWLEEKDNDEFFVELFSDNPPDKKEFYKTIKKILENIKKVRETPENKREYDI